MTPTSPHITPRSSDNKGWKYTEPVNGFVHRSLSLDALLGAVEKQRFSLAGKELECDLSAGWQMRFLDELCRQNPNAPCTPNQLSPDFEPPHVAIGRALWKELHERAEMDNDPYALRSWLDRWIERIPDVSGCRCRSNSVQLLNAIPPPFDSGFKDWAIRFHNEINKRLGKKKWPYV